MLLNNDVLVTPEWLTRMHRTYLAHPHMGIIGPMTNYASGKQQIKMEGRYEEFAAELRKAQDKEWEPVNRIIGFCMLFSRELLKRVGMLDERFSPGHFEDDDYCLRVRNAGYKVVMAKDVFVYHYGSASFKEYAQEELETLLARNRQLFIDKWGVDPVELAGEDIKGERHANTDVS